MKRKIIELLFVITKFLNKLFLYLPSFIFIFSKLRKNIDNGDIENIIKDDGKVLTYYRYLLMPTRLYSEIMKKKDKENFPEYMKEMTKFSLFMSIFLLVTFIISDIILNVVLEVKTPNSFSYYLSIDYFCYLFIGINFLIILWSLSRVSEIFYAFYNDVHTHLKPKETNYIESGLKYHERIHLAMYSYVELIFLFAIIFYILDASFLEMFKQKLSAIDTIYFSGVTITTLGYGDIQPISWITKLLSVIEVICGFTLIVVSFTVYVSRAINDLNK